MKTKFLVSTLAMLSFHWMTAAQTASAQGKQSGSSRWQHDGPVVFVAYTPDGKQVLTATYEGALRKWDAATGKSQVIEKGIKGGSTTDVRCRVAALSPDGKTLAVATYASMVNVYSVGTGKKLRQLKTADDQLSGAGAVAFSPDSKTLLTGRLQGRSVSQWDLATGKELRKFGDAKGQPAFEFGTLGMAAGGKIVLSIGGDFQGAQRVGLLVRRWELAGKELSPVKGGGDGSVVLAADGKTAAWNSAKAGTIRLWDLEADKEILQLEGGGTVRVFSKDSKLLVGRDSERVLCLWDVQTGKVHRKIGEPSSRPINFRADVVAISADGKRLATGVGDEVRQWDTVSGTELGAGAK